MLTRISIAGFAFLIILSSAPLFALTSGTDVLVPAAGRGSGQADSMWITDLNILNIDDETASVEVFLLRRNRANPEPTHVSFTLEPGATLVLEDAILDVFGLESSGGAFRVVSDAEVVVASRIYNLKDSATFGQGFEGVSRTEAVPAGGGTDVVGLRNDARFRTNIVLVEASDLPDGSTVTLTLTDENGIEIAAETITLQQMEPRLFPVSNIVGTSFDYATLHIDVVTGSVIAAASKVDNDPDTGDPSTLEAWTKGATPDGTYRFAIFDSFRFASGGELIVEDGRVTEITGTYFNWDKTAGPDPECTLIFPWGGVLSPPVPVEDFASGVSLLTSFLEGGELGFTLTFDLHGRSLEGSIAATGVGFTGLDSGCNGDYPELDVEGGKVE